MIQIHGNCRSTGSNTLACGHSNVFFSCLSTGLLSAAVTLFPQLISSQQVIKDAAFRLLIQPAILFFQHRWNQQARNQWLIATKTSTTIWNFHNRGQHPVFICDIITFHNMRFNLQP